MADRVAHRGPDDEGFVVRGPAALGVRRLRIIDLETGRQPMTGEDGTVWVAFNGEIYNYRELTRRLTSAGHVFRTRSDTETIVHAWETRGPDALDDLEGMFGLAVWNDATRTLVLALDRRRDVRPAPRESPQHVLDRLRRPLLRRVDVRAARGRHPRYRAPRRGPGPERGARSGRGLGRSRRRAARRRLDPAHVSALALRAEVGHRRPVRRRRRRAVRRLSDLPGAPRGAHLGARAPSRPRGSARGGEPDAGLARQPQPRLPPQALRGRRRPRSRHAPRRVDGLVHARRAARPADAGRARAAPRRTVLRRVGADGGGGAGGALAPPRPLSGPQGLSRRGRAAEGGPRVDGVLAGGARAPARPPRGGGRRRPAARDEAASAHHQARAQVAAAQPAAPRHRAAAQAGLRRAARALVPHRAAAARARGVR